MLALTRLIETVAREGTEPMNRRAFVKTSVAAAAVAGVPNAPTQSQQETASAKAREYYELRQYHVQSGRQQKLTDAFLKDALVPALNRLGIASVGVFNLTIGPVTPTFYVLMAAASVETLATVEARLGQDAEYLKAGAPFLTSPADEAPFIRIESSLMVAFEGWPKLKLPAATTEHKERMFELRTYESPSDQDHRRKVEMFNSGEYDVFEKAGFSQVFYGDVLVGSRLPCLTYMVGFTDLTDRTAKWNAFREAPEWRKLSGSPRYAFESIVSSITNLILIPTTYSQI
jgi:hypothetical protein